MDSMVGKYASLVSGLKERKYRKVSLVGLVQRSDSRFDWKVEAINFKLKELCEKEGVGFVEPEIDTGSMLCKNGVHLNFRGCDQIARAIFQHSCSALNFVWPPLSQLGDLKGWEVT